MKKMRRVIAGLLVAVMMFALCACGKDMSGSAYCGKWVATTCEYSGMELSVADIYGTFELTLDEKGKAHVVTADDEATGKWDESENGVVVDGDMEFVSEDGKLVLDQDGVKIYFEKE